MLETWLSSPIPRLVVCDHRELRRVLDQFALLLCPRFVVVSGRRIWIGASTRAGSNRSSPSPRLAEKAYVNRTCYGGEHLKPLRFPGRLAFTSSKKGEEEANVAHCAACAELRCVRTVTGITTGRPPAGTRLGSRGSGSLHHLSSWCLGSWGLCLAWSGYCAEEHKLVPGVCSASHRAGCFGFA